MCGGTRPSALPSPVSRGLSPRVRGNLFFAVLPSAGVGSIPACAGEPLLHTAAIIQLRVYPRVCGGTNSTWWAPFARYGLSPRVRGNPAIFTSSWPSRGSIPACAGEPRSTTDHLRNSTVYPRVCGGTSCAAATGRPLWGLSPRVRGNHQRPSLETPKWRSIPACAGEPTVRASIMAALRVYPRVCGGTSGGAAASVSAKGLSPRVRGNRPSPRR